MASETLTIYARRIDPRGVVELLRTLDPTIEIDGPDDDWNSAMLRIAQPGIVEPLTLSFHHDPDYYDSEDWPVQMLGMRGYFDRFPDGANKEPTLRLIASFRFALSLGYEPNLMNAGDARLPYLYAVVRHLDGVLFTMSSLLDASGRTLYAADGTSDPDAAFPVIPDATSEEDEEDEPEPTPQTPERVARRAMALVAVTVRALMEQEDPEDPSNEEFRQRILDWIDAVGLTDELEPDEWEVLQRPVGRLDRQQQINATWRLEGLAVLAWALHRFEVPPHDTLVVPKDLVSVLHLLDDDAARQLIAEPKLRTEAELDWMGRRLLGLHWRMRDFTLRPLAMDFTNFARECWFGSFDLAGIRIIDNDLAIAGKSIAEADREAFLTAFSAARERHLAINWLRGYAHLYSRTDTST